MVMCAFLGFVGDAAGVLGARRRQSARAARTSVTCARETQERSVKVVRPAGVASSRTPAAVTVAASESGAPAKAQFQINWDSMGFIPYIAVFAVVVLARKLIAGQVDKVVNRDVKKGSVEGVEKGRPGVIMTEEQEKELHVFKCMGCGYEIWPARGREFKFFPDSFTCPVCGAPKSEFWDLNDDDDPRNWEEEEDEEENEEQVETGAADQENSSGVENSSEPVEMTENSETAVSEEIAEPVAESSDSKVREEGASGNEDGEGSSESGSSSATDDSDAQKTDDRGEASDEPKKSQ